ncbi:glycosyltransferase 87 family protein [Actinomycetota bacterium Odt1-20B]
MLAVSLTALVTLCALQGLPMADALVYRAEGAAVASGSDLYGFTVTEWQLPATYPPFAAILFVPTTWLPVAALKAAFLAANTALLALLLHLSAKSAGLPTRAAPLCAATALALWLEPVFQTVLFGQINLALACLVLWDLTRPPVSRHRPSKEGASRPTDPPGTLARGFGIGVAAGIKLTPAVFIAHLFLTRRTREGMTALAAFGGTVLLGALVLPYATVEFFTRRVFETGRVGKAWIVDNQSLQGLVARVLHTAEPGLAWAVPAGLIGVAGLWLARRSGDGPWGILAAACTALLVSPISWSHHWVWCVPLLVLLWARGHRRTAVAVAVVFTARTMWLLPHAGDLDLRLPWWQQALASPYPLLALGLLLSALRQEDVRVVEDPQHHEQQPAPRHHVLGHDL